MIYPFVCARVEAPLRRMSRKADVEQFVLTKTSRPMIDKGETESDEDVDPWVAMVVENEVVSNGEPDAIDALETSCVTFAQTDIKKMHS